MTEQEIFDAVWDWFVTKKNPRSFRGNTCAYRGYDGAKCAVGLFIPDASYDETLEGFRVRNYRVAAMLPPETRAHLMFLRELQDVHDIPDRDVTHICPEALREFAREHGLVAPDLATADLFAEVPNG